MSTYRVRLGVSLILNTIMAAIMPEIVYQTYVERGCELHFGGEWLLLWFAVIIVAGMFFERK